MKKPQIKKFSLLDHIFFLVKFKLICIGIYSIACGGNEAFAAKGFSFKVGDEISIYSDKALRDTRNDVLKATGNVVFIRKKETLYGEIATLDFKSGILEIEGNVRFIGPEYRLFGHSIKYNIRSGRLEVTNGKIISAGYIVIGDKLTRVNENIILAKEAEYTTCKDCPESWSVFGKELKIHLGEYLQVKNVLIKINGITMVYIPYVVLPLKRGRQTGLLFPHISFTSNNGASYMQPFFWTMGDTADGTVSPFIFSKRGKGGELQLRKTFGEKKWMNFNGVQVKDKIYRPDEDDFRVKKGHYSRYFLDYAHGFNIADRINHHLYYNHVRDLDIITDFDNFTNPFMAGNEFGGGANLDIRLPRVNLSAESYWVKNQIVTDNLAFDDDYVQILPKVNFELVPQTLFQSGIPGFNHLAFGLTGEFVKFRQNKIKQAVNLRNAERFSVAPTLNWNIVNLGPLALSHEIQNGFQFYRFPTKQGTPSFRKRNSVLKTELSLEFEKVFGLAYHENVPLSRVKFENYKKGNENKKIIGSFPSIDGDLKKNYIEKKQNAYKHLGEIKFIHYFGPEDRALGDSQFAKQIKRPDGLFDYLDALTREQHVVSNLSTNLTRVPRNNTIELQLFNSLIRKQAKGPNVGQSNEYITQNFEYSQMAYFNLSQGLELNTDTVDFSQNLTRLKVEMGYNIGDVNLSLSDFYFHDDRDHILDFSFQKSWPWAVLNGSFSYDTKSAVRRRFLSTDLTFSPSDWYSFKIFYEYDFINDIITNNSYIVEYSPRNNCWKIDVNYSQNEIDKRIALNFYLNFGKNKFTSLTGISNEF